ncbi:hypothetical protein RD792_009711 [Penstemon davidsonii]|uniref:F-box domain-containing protein n=1 Tax=Penstemon davidsonii TaxID=160366 RepID=A0ABR0CZT6_9LAMI|nr:hypothetical protein RD792_009699 [Penstemon davidsonii]KAK4482551.1 hypothetical protein RD792_009711 [Penstemon davidsonii]
MDRESKVEKSVFGGLSGDSISEILSRTSPLDASRFAIISKAFKSASDLDTVWEKFVPMEILSRSVSPPVLYHGTKKELFFSLCESPILIDGGKLSFFLDKKSGKKCFTVGARELIISWEDHPDYWIWTSHPDSRFSEVAQLKMVCWLDIRGKIKTDMLSQKTNYKAYLIFKFATAIYGLESMYSVVRLVNHEADSEAEERATLVHPHRGHPMYRHPMPRQPGRLPVRRDDGWMEIEMGDFYNELGDDGEVEARLMEIWRLHGKAGLIVEGIEFRPSTSLNRRNDAIRRTT